VQQGPVFAVTLAECADGRTLLLLSWPHLAADGVESVEIVVGELAECYRARAVGEAPDLAPPATTYPDFAAANRRALAGDARARLLEHWRDWLPPKTPDPPVGLPTLVPGSGPALGSAAVAEVPVPAEVTEMLPGLRARFRTTTFVLYLAALLAAVRSMSEQREVGALFAVNVRSRYRAHGLAGCFSTLSALWLPVDPGESIAGVTGRIRARVIDAFTLSDLPFNEIIRDLYPQWWDDIESPPYVFFTASEPRLSSWTAGGVTARPYRPGAGEPLRHLHPGLKVMVRQRPTGAVLACQYAVAAYAPEVIETLLTTTAATLRTLARDPAATVSGLSSRHFSR
jgi:hypothetical protein